MATWEQRISTQITNAAQRLARQRAKHLLQESRDIIREREKARRALRRKRSDLGSAVIQAGVQDWSVDEVTGALLAAKQDAGDSPTMRLAWAKQARAARAVGP